MWSGWVCPDVSVPTEAADPMAAGVVEAHPSRACLWPASAALPTAPAEAVSPTDDVVMSAAVESSTGICPKAAASVAAVPFAMLVIFCELFDQAAVGGWFVAITCSAPVATVGAVPVPPTTMDVSAAVTEETPPPAPFAAAVSRPFESTVMLAFVYDPGVTAVAASVGLGNVPVRSPPAAAPDCNAPVIRESFPAATVPAAVPTFAFTVGAVAVPPTVTVVSAAVTDCTPPAVICDARAYTTGAVTVPPCEPSNLTDWPASATPSCVNVTVHGPSPGRYQRTRVLTVAGIVTGAIP
jgi:hypothetical protein